MTTTSVKDVGSMLNNLSTGASYKATGGFDVSFQSVLNGQTSGGEGDFAEVSGKNTKSTIKDAGEALKAKDNRQITDRRAVEKEEVPDEVVDVEEEENLEEAMEILGSTAMDLLEQIGNTFDISMEEMQDMLAQMKMTPTDLLHPENLSAFLLQLAGAEDSMMLLTNEALYGDYKEMMQELDNLLSGDSGMGGMSLEQLKAAVEEQLAMQQNAEEAEPMVEITVEDGEMQSVENPKDAVNGQTDENGAVELTKNTHAAENEREAGNRDGGNRTGDHAGQGPLFQQNLTTEALAAQEATGAVTPSFSPETVNIMRQVMDYMRVNIKPDVSNLEMQLHPASLGTLQVQVSAKGGVLTANFVTENETVKAALESQMVQLKENFNAQGIRVEAIEVTVQTHQFEQNLEQGRGREENGNDTGRSTQRTRRINLNSLFNEDEMEELNEEEQLAAEMMAANGNTVDYTV